MFLKILVDRQAHGTVHLLQSNFEFQSYIFARLLLMIHRLVLHIEYCV